jgi:hypothetical protein
MVRDMVMDNKFKYPGKFTENRYWPLIANMRILPFLRRGTIAAYFYRVGK